MTTLNIADYKSENWSVSKSITDALWTLSAQIDKHITPAFFTKIRAVAQDHNDVDRTPFVGIVPGSDYIMAPVTNKATLVGYDYAWYLTTQYVPATDRITDIDTDPATTVETLLGGSVNWTTVTGVKPFRMIADADWSAGLVRKKVFEFEAKCTRWQAIQEICEYCNYVFVVKPYYDSGDWYSYAYFIPEADIDNASPTGLDLPAMVTFTKPDAYLLPGTSVSDSPEKAYNRIKVTGYNESTQTYYYSTDGAANTYETAGVTAGTELAIEYFYESNDLDSQAKVTARATAFLNYFQASSKVYTARLKRRMDLELYQKIRFADYDKIEGTTGVPVDMRITRISYRHAAVNDIVEIEFCKDQDAQQLRRLTEVVNPDSVMGMMSVIDDDLHDIGLIDPMGYRYLRTDKHATTDQNLYTALTARSSKQFVSGYIDPTSGDEVLGGEVYALSENWNEESGYTSAELNVHAQEDLKLTADHIMRFKDAENASMTLLELVNAAGGVYLPLAGGAGNPMVGDLYMNGNDIKELNQLFGKVDVGFTWDLIFYGSNVGGSADVEFMRWDASLQNINVAGKKITNLATGTAASDAVRYDQLSAGYVHPSARQCTTGDWAWASITGKPSLYTQAEINTWRAGTTVTEMGRVHGVTSDIQTQLNARMLLSVYDPGSDGYVIPTAGGTGFGTYVKGDILYASANDVLAKRVAGTENQVLTMNATLVPVWAASVADSLWEVDGSETQLITADDIDMRAKGFMHVGSLQPEVSGGMTIFDSAGATKAYLGTTAYSFKANADIDMATSWQIKNLKAGAASLDAVNYGQLAAYLPLSAGSGKPLTGDLYMGGKTIVDAHNIYMHDTGGLWDALYIKSASGVKDAVKILVYDDDTVGAALYGELSMQTNKITDLAAGAASSNDAARMVNLDSYLLLAGGTMTSEAGINMNMGYLSEIGSLKGGVGWDFIFYGSDDDVGSPALMEFMRWDASAETLLIGGNGIDMNSGDISDVDDLIFAGSSSLIDMNGGDITEVDEISGTSGVPLKIEFMGTTAYRIYIDSTTPYYNRYETVVAHEFDIGSTAICYVASDGITMAAGKKIKSVAANDLILQAPSGKKIKFVIG